ARPDCMASGSQDLPCPGTHTSCRSGGSRCPLQPLLCTACRRFFLVVPAYLCRVGLRCRPSGTSNWIPASQNVIRFDTTRRCCRLGQHGSLETRAASFLRSFAAFDDPSGGPHAC